MGGEPSPILRDHQVRLFRDGDMHVRKGFKESTQCFWHREQHVQSWRASFLGKMARVAGGEGGDSQ